ncbi:MAG: hypothetical protein JSU68_12680 [Phycisphaerales bacterium]|nr:MAG: hypothetical protein JSU68_12680 [Phycisphaerales bacterium]
MQSDHGKRAAGTGPAVSQLISRLSELRNRFSPTDRAEKLRLLTQLHGRTISRPALLLAFHETLCFLQAYPDDARVLDATDRALARVADRVRVLEDRHPAALQELDDTGMIGTRISYPHTWPVVRELVRLFPDHVRIDREDYDDTDKLDELVRMLVCRLEYDALDDTEADPWEFLDQVSRAEDVTDLSWLVRRLEEAPWPEDTKARLYDTLGLWMDFRLDRRSVSRTLAWRRPKNVAFQRKPLPGRSPDTARAITRPAPLPRRLSDQRGAELIRRARLTSCLRRREVYGHTHGNPAEVYVTQPGNGIEIAYIGALPEYRFPLESTYATAIIKNGAPIGYGYHTLLFDRAETGINIYDTFRGAEAAYIFERMLAGLYALFGVTRFIVHRYQIGDDNEEAVQSGSYWFYYKMGFRPLDPKAAALTRRELDRIQRQPDYRSSAPTLRRLARTEMFLGVKGHRPDTGGDLRPGLLALRVSAHIQRAFAGDRNAARKAAAASVARKLNLTRPHSWPAPQKRWYQRLCVLLNLIPDLGDWPDRDKTSLARILQAKGASQELLYVRRMQKHLRFRQAIELLAAGKLNQSS